MTKKSDEAGKADAALETFIPAVTFDGYPFDEAGRPVRFIKGRESIPVPADYVAMLRDKSLVSEKATKPATEDKPKA